MGCMFTWTWVGIAKPASMAIISTVFADHLCHALLPENFISTWLIKLVGVLGLVIMTLINCTGARSGVKAANIIHSCLTS